MGVAAGSGGRTGGVEYGVVEIGVGVGLGAGAEEALTFARTHVGDVFREVGNSLLRFEFVGFRFCVVAWFDLLK